VYRVKIIMPTLRTKLSRFVTLDVTINHFQPAACKIIDYVDSEFLRKAPRR